MMRHALVLLACLGGAPAAPWTPAAGAEAPAGDAPILLRRQFRLEPTPEQLQTLPSFPAQWRIDAEMLRDWDRSLAAAGFSADLLEELRAHLRIDPAGGDGVIVPETAWLDRFTERDRTRWRELLAWQPVNTGARWPLAVRPAVIAALAADPALAEAARRLQRWAVPSGDWLVFSDPFALEDAFPSAAARQDFYRRVLGTNALWLRVGEDADGNLAPTIRYWQASGSYRALEPFFQAIGAVAEYDRIDIAHVLPRFPRGVLYTFPTDFAAHGDVAIDSGVVAAGFFATSAYAALRAQGGFAAWLRRECEPAADAPRFGDLVVWEDPASVVWPYVAVYIADNVVLGRRPTLAGPWLFMDIPDVARMNPRLAAYGPHVFRRRPAPDAAAAPPMPAPMPARPARVEFKRGKAGPWGQFHVYPVVLAPPARLLAEQPAPRTAPEWRFQELSAGQARREIQAVPMPDATRRALLEAFARGTVNADGDLVVRPDPDLVWRTPAELRRRLFPKLVYTLAGDYAQGIAIASRQSAESWFPEDDLPAPVRDAILGLVYPYNQGLALSDYGALFARLPDPEDWREAQRALLRTPALVVLLEKPAPEDVPALARYWRLDRQKDLTALLESFAASDATHLDIVHLLPPLAREFLNLYIRTPAQSPTASCYWTALNFDVEEPDPALLVTRGASVREDLAARQVLLSRYEPVSAPERLGDVIVYQTRGPRPRLLHACSYVGDDVVFTRNGYGFAKPWCLMRLADVDALYLDPATVERAYYRRR